MPATNKQWARGYALQALSDLRVREKLVDANVEKCHRLHFLQMAAEKVCKAHLAAASGHDNLRKSHAYVSDTLPTIARVYYAKINDNNEISAWEISEVRCLAREIQMLASACKDGGIREDNSEYPWKDAKGNIRIPCKYSFPSIDDGNRAIIRLIRLISYRCGIIQSMSEDGRSTETDPLPYVTNLENRRRDQYPPSAGTGPAHRRHSA
jgi:hypothetical protein